MLNSIEDIRLPLQMIFDENGAGDTLTIWDQYFIGSMDFRNVRSVSDTIASVQEIRHVIVYIDDTKLNYDTRNGDGLDALRNLRDDLAEFHITFEVFDYASRRDHCNRIHGRYWLSGSLGFLMDGSLDGVGTNLCFAVTMDDSTFSKIQRVLEPKKEAYCRPIDLNTFRSRFSCQLAGQRNAGEAQ